MPEGELEKKDDFNNHVSAPNVEYCVSAAGKSA
jgi:hypothetical protein